MPHAAQPATADLVRLGAAFNHPLQVVATNVHVGNLADADQTVAVSPDSVILSSLKKAEDEEAFVFRMHETAGKATVAKVMLSPTLLGKIKDVVEVDLLERPVGKSSASKVAGGLSVKVSPFGIASVRVTFQA
jgi:alpha-mannosidase